MVPPFEVSVVGSGASVVVHISGGLDLFTARRLREEMVRVVGGGARDLTVDVAALDFIDSSGLHVLVGALKRLRAEGGALALRSPNASARKVFEITGLATVMNIVDGDGRAACVSAPGRIASP